MDKKKWEIKDITTYSVGQWEPNFDKELWKKKKQLHVFSQNVSQADGEGLAKEDPQPVRVITVKNAPKLN